MKKKKKNSKKKKLKKLDCKGIEITTTDMVGKIVTSFDMNAFMPIGKW